MKTNDFNYWDKSKYNEPSYFLKILRRHIITAAFSHPKHGGNTHAIGWKFIEDLTKDKVDATSNFDWQQSLEKQLGKNNEYIA